MGNGILLFIAGATALWIIGKGYGKNLGSAWNTLTGATSSQTTTASPASPNAAPGPFGGPPDPQLVPPIGAPNYTPSPISYLGNSIAA